MDYKELLSLAALGKKLPGNKYQDMFGSAASKLNGEPDTTLTPQSTGVLDRIYRKYPAFKNMGEVTLKADPEFTSEKTGVGDIEYFSTESDRGVVTYPNGYQ